MGPVPPPYVLSHLSLTFAELYYYSFCQSTNLWAQVPGPVFGDSPVERQHHLPEKNLCRERQIVIGGQVAMCKGGNLPHSPWCSYHWEVGSRSPPPESVLACVTHLTSRNAMCVTCGSSILGNKALRLCVCLLNTGSQATLAWNTGVMPWGCPSHERSLLWVLQSKPHLSCQPTGGTILDSHSVKTSEDCCPR